MPNPLPRLSRFELECLRRLWDRGEASVRDIQADLPEAPGYSTVRKIVERLERKGAVRRARLKGKAWLYRPAVPRQSLLRREIRRFLDLFFDGSAAPLVAQLAEMEALSPGDLEEIEKLAAKPLRARRGREGRP